MVVMEVEGSGLEGEKYGRRRQEVDRLRVIMRKETEDGGYQS